MLAASSPILVRLLVFACFASLTIACATNGRQRLPSSDQSELQCVPGTKNSQGEISQTERKYFESLLQNESGPLESYMRLWYPNRREADDAEGFLDGCRTGPFKGLRRQKDNSLGSCAPDTLYSWGSIQKVTTLKLTMPDGKVWKGKPNRGGPIFSTFSAIGTFGYGEIPVRFKIRPGTTFSYGDKEGTVQYYGPDFNQDFVILDAGVLESWSFGTAEHYDEIVRDYWRYKSGKPWIGYLPGPGSFSKGGELFIAIDTHEFTEAKLKSALRRMIQMILDQEGAISYSEGACRNRLKAFETRHPTYINPF